MLTFLGRHIVLIERCLQGNKAQAPFCCEGNCELRVEEVFCQHGPWSGQEVVPRQISDCRRHLEGGIFDHLDYRRDLSNAEAAESVNPMESIVEHQAAPDFENVDC